VQDHKDQLQDPPVQQDLKATQAMLVQQDQQDHKVFKE
jgi:hypothetical protein